MNEKALVKARFDRRGERLPVWEVYRWQGNHRWMLAAFGRQDDAINYANRINAEEGALR